MSVAAPFRRTLEDIAENAADVIIIIIGIVILYALFTIGTKLWSGLQGLFSGIQGLGGIGGNPTVQTGGGIGGSPYTTGGGGIYTPPVGGSLGNLYYQGQNIPINQGGPRGQTGYQGVPGQYPIDPIQRLAYWYPTTNTPYPTRTFPIYNTIPIAYKAPPPTTVPYVPPTVPYIIGPGYTTPH